MSSEDRELAFDAGFFRVERQRPPGRATPVTLLRMPDWVITAAIDAEGRFVLVRQHRWGIAAETLEAAGGIVDAGEEPAAAGLRELLEETGYTGQVAEPLGWVHPNPVLQDNRCFMFLVRGAVRAAAPVDDPDERVTTVLLSRAAVEAALADGTITHALAVVALTRALAATRSAG